jgi:hypothetical protein
MLANTLFRHLFSLLDLWGFIIVIINLRLYITDRFLTDNLWSILIRSERSHLLSSRHQIIFSFFCIERIEDNFVEIIILPISGKEFKESDQRLLGNLLQRSLVIY